MTEQLDLLVDFGLPALALGLALLVRVQFVKLSSGSAVDHFYWILVAKLFRSSFRLPVEMDGKYILEDDRLSYPFGFGYFLSFFSEKFLRSSKSRYITLSIDFAVLILLMLVGLLVGLDGLGITVIAIVYGLAPVLVSYNTQLTSRGLGNLFLICSLFFQLLSVKSGINLCLLFGFFGVVTLAAMFVTHKMTTQYYIFLSPGWGYCMMSYGEYGWLVFIAVTILALGFATLVTGLAYQKLQWLAHFEIISFWNRNWRNLGAHQFRDSPIYGKVNNASISRFHERGVKGILKHCSLLFAYLPLAFFLPFTLLISPFPEEWIYIPAMFAMTLAVFTLFVPRWKCLGGGHLYMFNAVPFVSIWWGILISENYTSSLIVTIFAIGLSLTFISLILGARRRSINDKDVCNHTPLLIEHLSKMPTQNIAIFPMQHAEQIALETSHSVFWGAHGLGFKNLEPYWPVMRKEIGKSMRSHDVKTVILDLQFWPEGEAVLVEEIGNKEISYIGKFAIFKVF